LFDTDLDGDEEVTRIDSIIKDIYAGQVVTSPQQVINRLTIMSTEDQQQQGTGWNEELNYCHLECLFMAHRQCYILGGEGAQRAQKMVKLMTGDEYLPLSPLGSLTVCSSL
jgi:hypothetical protein